LRCTNLPSDDSAEDMLAQLALDLSLTANHASSRIWSRLNPELWEQTRNPWAVLQTISGRSLEAIMSEPGFRAALNDVVNARSAEDKVPRWFQQKYPNSKLTCVAYFSMEYMLTEALPIYSGGLGNVAGDQLKAANDLGVPVIGVGLLYSQGYFRQELDRNGMNKLFKRPVPSRIRIDQCRITCFMFTCDES
jgi:glycogen phosphorylase